MLAAAWDKSTETGSGSAGRLSRTASRPGSQGLRQSRGSRRAGRPLCSRGCCEPGRLAVRGRCGRCRYSNRSRSRGGRCAWLAALTAVKRQTGSGAAALLEGLLRAGDGSRSGGAVGRCRYSNRSCSRGGRCAWLAALTAVKRQPESGAAALLEGLLRAGTARGPGAVSGGAVTQIDRIREGVVARGLQRLRQSRGSRGAGCCFA